MPRLILLISIFLAIHVTASPKDAERIKRTYDLSKEAWELKLKIATSPEEKLAVWKTHPDIRETATKLWPTIAPFLKQDWTIPYSSFFLSLTRNIPAGNENSGIDFSKQNQAIIRAFSENHLQKPGIDQFCIALVESGSPQALGLLEKIIKTNPNEANQGIAALGAALILKNLGDSTDLIKKRLTYLKTAINFAADQNIGDTPVKDIINDEIFIISYLTKGRTPPDFSGTDVAARVIKLSEFKGKVTVLLFWDGKSQETAKLIELTNQLVDKNAGKPFSVIGITPESTAIIRELQADGTIQWNNIIDPSEKISAQYRIKNRPTVFILDKSGNIAFTGLPGSFVDLTVDGMLLDSK